MKINQISVSNPGFEIRHERDMLSLSNTFPLIIGCCQRTRIVIINRNPRELRWFVNLKKVFSRVKKKLTSSFNQIGEACYCYCEDSCLIQDAEQLVNMFRAKGTLIYRQYQIRYLVRTTERHDRIHLVTV